MYFYTNSALTLQKSVYWFNNKSTGSYPQDFIPRYHTLISYPDADDKKYYTLSCGGLGAKKQHRYLYVKSKKIKTKQKRIFLEKTLKNYSKCINSHFFFLLKFCIFIGS